MDATGRRHSFGNVDHPSEHLIERFPSADPLADRAIAAIRTVTGRDNVAHTRQAVKRLVPSPQVDAQAGDLDQSAREEGGLGVIARAQTVANARGDPQDVLERTGQLDPERVAARVNAKRAVGERIADLFVERFVRAGDDHRSG